MNGSHFQFTTEIGKPQIQEGVKTPRLKKPFPEEKMTQMRQTKPFPWFLSKKSQTAKGYKVVERKVGIKYSIQLEDVL